MKTLLSIGGWTYSTNFPILASTAASRATFASTAVTFVKDLGFDGIDIDWEYPASDTDAANFVLLLAALRSALDAYAAVSAPGYHFLITVASPAGPTNYDIEHLSAMNAYLDQWNLMAYDYAGSWDTNSGHQANIMPNAASMVTTPFSTTQAITDYIAAGIPPNKIVLGFPLYGRSFESTTGLGAPFSGIGTGSWEAGVWDYKVLPLAGATEIWDPVAQASYSYNSATQELISYDNMASAMNKVTYLKEEGLGGAMFWESSGDRTDGGSLISGVAAAMGVLDDSANLLSYPASQYANMVAGFPSG